jgi:plastocyanin
VAGRWLSTTAAEKQGPAVSGACGGHRKQTRFTPRWSSEATPSRRGAARAGSSMAACEAPTVAVSFLQDSVRTAVGDRQSLRWTEEGVVEHSVQHLVGARTQRRGRSLELGVGAAQEKESGTGGGGGRTESCGHTVHEGGAGGRRSADGRRQPVGNDPDTLATSSQRGCSKQRRWGTAVWAPWYSAGRPGETPFNRFENQFKQIQMISKLFKL